MKSIIYIFNLITFIISFMCLNGCIAQNNSNCPIDFNILFTYIPKGTGQDIFKGNINKVNMYIYNQNNELIQHKIINYKELAKHQGATITGLNNGDYKIVLWANVNENTVIKGSNIGDKLNAMQVINVSQYNNIPTFDKLCFSQGAISIKNQQLVSNKTFNFTPAYFSIKVIVTGLNAYPKFILNNMNYAITVNNTGSLSFVQNEGANNKAYVPNFYIDKNQDLVAQFNIPCFTDGTKGVFSLISAEGVELIKDKPLVNVVNEYIASELAKGHKIILEQGYLVEIPIYILYTKDYIKIGVTKWENINTAPNIIS